MRACANEHWQIRHSIGYYGVGASGGRTDVVTILGDYWQSLARRKKKNCADVTYDKRKAIFGVAAWCTRGQESHGPAAASAIKVNIILGP